MTSAMSENSLLKQQASAPTSSNAWLPLAWAEIAMMVHNQHQQSPEAL
jgi:hypothetical protein